MAGSRPNVNGETGEALPFSGLLRQMAGLKAEWKYERNENVMTRAVRGKYESKKEAQNVYQPPVVRSGMHKNYPGLMKTCCIDHC